MSENTEAVSLGRKIFFLHPSAVIQNQVVPELAQEEFEVYAVKDETKLRRVLKKYPNSIVIACINEGMRENAWEEWIKGTLANGDTAGVDIGVIASVDDAAARRRYTDQIKLRCGYTVWKPSEFSGMMKILVDILNAVNAKGRRKYIRAVTGNETNITINIPMNGTFVNGLIRDISSVGLSCTFADSPSLAKNSHFPDLQIRLQTQLLKIEGIVFGSRQDGADKIYVILFTQRLSPDVRTRIRKFIQSYLQSAMDAEFK